MKGSNRLPTGRFSTDDVAPEHAFEAWKQLMGASHDIAADPTAFHGAVTSTQVGPMLVHRMAASPQSVERSRRRIRRDGLEHIVLHMNMAPMRGATDDRSIVTPGGAINVNALSQPIARQTSPDIDSIIVSLSRDLVCDVIAEPERLHGSVYDASTGPLLRAHLQVLAASAPDIDPDSALDVARASVLLLAATARPTRATLGDARRPLETATLFRAKRFIDANLRSPRLGPDLVEATIGVSRRTLYRLFAPLGGVAAFIRERRLAAVYDALTRSKARVQIAEVAYAFGFVDMAHFSRAFKAAYGVTASEVLAQAGAHSTVLDTTLEGSAFTTWVRSLG